MKRRLIALVLFFVIFGGVLFVQAEGTSEATEPVATEVADSGEGTDAGDAAPDNGLSPILDPNVVVVSVVVIVLAMLVAGTVMGYKLIESLGFSLPESSVRTVFDQLATLLDQQTSRLSNVVLESDTKIDDFVLERATLGKDKLLEYLREQLFTDDDIAEIAKAAATAPAGSVSGTKAAVLS